MSTSASRVEILSSQVQLLEVERAELASVKPGREVYQRRGELLVLTDPREAAARVEQQLAEAKRALAAAQAAQRKQAVA